MANKLGSALLTFYLILLAGWSLVAYAGLGKLLLSDGMFARKIDGNVAIIDFVNVYNAGLLSRRSVSGEHLNIYDPEIQAASQERLIAPVKPDHPFYLQYPPYFFALMLPLSIFTMQGAFVLWSITGGIGLLFGLTWLLRQTGLGRGARVFSIIAVLASYPVWLSFGMGQTSLLNFLFLMLTVLLLRRKSALAAGLVGSLVAIKMQYAPAIFLLGLLLGGRRFAFGFAGGLAALVVFSIGILGVDNLLNWPRALLMGETSSTVSGVSPVTMPCIRGYLTLLFPQVDARTIALVAGVFLLGGLAVIFTLWRRYLQGARSDAEFRMTMSLSFMLMLITSLHTHGYDYVLMSLPALWLFDQYKNESTAESRCLHYLILLYPPLSWLAAKFNSQLSSIYIMFNLLWAVGMLLLVARLRWKAQPEPVVEPAVQ